MTKFPRMNDLLRRRIRPAMPAHRESRLRIIGRRLGLTEEIVELASELATSILLTFQATSEPMPEQAGDAMEEVLPSQGNRGRGRQSMALDELGENAMTGPLRECLAKAARTSDKLAARCAWQEQRNLRGNSQAD